MNIYIAAWHVKSESGDDYMGQVVMAEKNEEEALKHIIANCAEVDAMLCEVEGDPETMTPEEILKECLLFPDVIWKEITLESDSDILWKLVK